MAQSRRILPPPTAGGCSPACRPSTGQQVGILAMRLPAAFSVLAMGLALSGCTPIGDSICLVHLPNPIINIREAPRASTPPPAPTISKRISDRTIVVDAGHGGKDPGAMPKFRGQMKEKDINLDIATKVAGDLGSRGARVVMTRTRDVFLELDDRAKLADRHRADLFVSIHADSSAKKWISGTGIHIHTHASLETMRIAQCIASSFRRNGISCRGIVRNNFHVLREHNSPGILIEAGYMTNATDAQRLNDAAYRSRLASAIAEGIADHFSR